MKLISITLISLYVSVGLADLYMHQLRGSNNRLNEKSANRRNANRLFDSQNNNRGGYNVGELGSAGNAFPNNNNAYPTDQKIFDYSDKTWEDASTQFEETFLESSVQSITWTAQHGCGNPKNNCNMVLEYTCDTHPQDDNVLAGNYNGPGATATARQSTQTAQNLDYSVITGLRVQLKNGANTNTPNDPNNIKQVQATFQNNNGDSEGRHESEEYYVFAKNRERNKGLFTADQKLKGDDSTKTRQNPGGTRRGLEVPEERDYFPYWKPSPWRPVAIFHNNLQECESQMRSKSSAIQTKFACVPTKTQLTQLNNNELENIVGAKTQTECTTANDGDAGKTGTWISQKFDMPAGYPVCVQNKWSQVNNLGNTADTPNGGLPQNWDWQIPTLAQLKASGCYVYQTQQGDVGAANGGGAAQQQYVRMVVRQRYNMTTMDYSPYETFSECNQKVSRNQRVQSPVEQNPTVDVGVEMQGLRLAINTAQLGRTFQDRSHVFRVMGRPQNAAGNAVGTLASKVVKNVSVQGKRGNIVQTFPAVEYDYWPKIVNVAVGECLAFQWTGSNTHNNGNPGGDGQTGDAGEGADGTDRSNLMQILDKNSTFPVPLDKNVVADFFAYSQVFQTYTGKPVSSGQQVSGVALAADAWDTTRDAQAYFMSAGFWNAETEIAANKATSGLDNSELNVLLNNTPASMKSMTVCPQRVGTYEFTCTRNNNFSNRDQKLTIHVTQN